jgi:hypothetical protein
MKHLHLHPFNILSVHEMKLRNNIRHVEYCRWFTVVTFFTDELRYQLSSYINSLQSHICSGNISNEIKDTPLNAQGVCVCARAIS